MYIGNDISEEIQIIDDLTRIMGVKNYWKTSHPSTNREFKTVLDLSQSNEIPIKLKFPMVSKKKNAIEQNRDNIKQIDGPNRKRVQQSRKTSSIFSKPPLPHNSLHEVEYPLPSLNNTKEQNLAILESLTKNFKLFKRSVRQKSYSLLQQPEEQQDEEEKLFLTNAAQQDISLNINHGQSEYEMQIPKQKSDRKRTLSEYESLQEKEKKKIHRQTMNFNGINMPYKLYMLANSRSKLLSHVMNEQERAKSFEQYGDGYQEKYFDRIKKEDASKLEKKMELQENEEKKFEMISRSQMRNAYYGLKALKKKSQQNVMQAYKLNLPSDSRFYNL